MRKALIGLILAATALVPVAAEAQRGHRGGDDGDRGSWSGRNNGGNRGESRAARSEARNEARQQQQQQPQVQQQQPQQPQVVQRQRGDGGNRGNWNRGDNGGNRGGDSNGARGDGNRGNWNGGDNGRTRNNQRSVYPQAWQGNPNDPRLQRYRELEQRNQNGGYRRGDRDRRDWRNDQGGQNDRNWRDGRRGDDRNRRGNWNRGWRNDNRYNWSSWRNQNRGRFHLSPYYSPYRNWRYQRFSVGLILDSLFYNQRYWIGDPWEYRLPPAPYGTQWVRYYDDVLLVDIYTGEVVDVIYDFFW